MRNFLIEEKLFRLTIFKLAPGETPKSPYKGDYQGKTGYIRSQRRGAPVGMKESQWEDSCIEGGPEALLENLIKSGYPWNLLGQRLQIIHNEMQTVTNEYGNIQKSIEGLNQDVGALRRDLPTTIENTIEKILNTRTSEINFRWALSIIGAIGLLAGLIIEIVTDETALKFLKNNGSWLGIVLMLIFAIVIGFAVKRRKKTSIT